MSEEVTPPVVPQPRPDLYIKVALESIRAIEGGMSTVEFLRENEPTAAQLISDIRPYISFNEIDKKLRLNDAGIQFLENYRG